VFCMVSSSSSSSSLFTPVSVVMLSCEGDSSQNMQCLDKMYCVVIFSDHFFSNKFNFIKNRYIKAHQEGVDARGHGFEA